MNRRGPSPLLNQGLFTALPLELVVDILARLPVRTIIRCKCVCKSWLGLISSDEFSKLHLSKSARSLAIYYTSPYRMRSSTPFRRVSGSNHISHSRLHGGAYSLFEIEEGRDLELCFSDVGKVNLPNHKGLSVGGFANGLLFLQDRARHEFFHVCNPITREYVQFPFPQPASSSEYDITYGFGASKITGQLKVVRLFRLENHGFECRCEVHTLGTGSWRRTAFAAALKYRGYDKYGSSFLNGNLHWLVQDLNGCPWISCFDLEAEVFSVISTPTLSSGTSFAILGSYLCLCDNTGNDIVIWLMKEYGVEKSWTKEFVVSNCFDFCNFRGALVTFYPIWILNDGILLRTSYRSFVVQYSKKNGRFLIEYPKMTGIRPCMACRMIFLHTPSFLSLKSLGMENVRYLRS